MVSHMKATLDIPEDLYRKVKSKSALSGQPVRAVAINLFTEWVNEPFPSPVATTQSTPAWFGIARPYAAKAKEHDMVAVRASIAKGRTRP